MLKEAEKSHLTQQQQQHTHMWSAREATHVVKQSFFGVFAIFFVESFLKNAHSCRHEQGKSQHGDSWNTTALFTHQSFGLSNALRSTRAWRCHIKFTQKPVQKSINSFFFCGSLLNVLQKEKQMRAAVWSAVTLLLLIHKSPEEMSTNSPLV